MTRHHGPFDPSHDPTAGRSIISAKEARGGLHAVVLHGSGKSSGAIDLLPNDNKCKNIDGKSKASLRTNIYMINLIQSDLTLFIKYFKFSHLPKCCTVTNSKLTQIQRT